MTGEPVSAFDVIDRAIRDLHRKLEERDVLLSVANKRIAILEREVADLRRQLPRPAVSGLIDATRLTAP